jgi:hypothetical protein
MMSRSLWSEAVFSLTQVAISTIVGAIVAYVMVVAYARWVKVEIPTADALLLAVTVGVSILLWREAGNTQLLNDDPIPVVSPNDVLSPVVTYVCLGMLAAFRTSIDGPHWPRLRALLTLVSLVVNIVTI